MGIKTSVILGIITCKYCGKFICYKVNNVQEKKVLNKTEVKDTKDMIYRVN